MLSNLIRNAYNPCLGLLRSKKGRGLKTIIVGGVAGGASCAARLRRLDESANIIMVEKGPYISFANCGLPYYIGGTIKDREALLVQTPQGMKGRFNIDIRIKSEVLKIDTKAKQVEIKNWENNTVYKESYDKLVLSPGAEPIVPPLKGINSKKIFTLRSVPDTDKIKEFCDTQKPKHAIVIGGGFIGLEMVENLHDRGICVTLIEMSDQVMGPLDYEMAALIHQYLKLKNVEVFLSDGVKEFEDTKSGITAKLSSGKELNADLVILAIGVKPDIKLAKEAGLGVKRGIVTNQKLETTDPDIYAVGDAIEVKELVNGDSAVIPLAGPANKQGRIVADQIVGRHSVYKGTQGTGICKVFELEAAATGLNERQLKQKNIPYLESIHHSGSHAGYYPGSMTLALKITFCPSTGRLFGAQVVGGKGADKRIDIFATAIRQKLTVYDLEELELAYAPPFGTAKDPVNYSGFVAANILKGDVQMVSWHQIPQLKKEGAFLIDVRTKQEYEMGTIPGAMNLPLHTIRDFLGTIPKHSKIIVFCQAGLRAYIAYRILKQNNFEEVYDLNGGFKTWHFANLKQSNTHIFTMDKISTSGMVTMNVEKALNSNYVYWSEELDDFKPHKQAVKQGDDDHN